MLRYILVDDDPSTLKFVKAKINQLDNAFGLEHVASYSSSKEAYEKINPETFDLLIVDFEMPVYNGIELAERIAKDKKVIFLTSTTANEKIVINTINIAGYLSKPFDVEEFETVLKKKVISSKSPLTNQNNKPSYFLSIGATKNININPEKIYYISTSRNVNAKQPLKNHVNIYGKKDHLLFENVRTTISQLLKELELLNFLKINQSTIVNKTYILQRDNIHLNLFDCRETFSISEKEKNAVIESFNKA